MTAEHASSPEPVRGRTRLLVLAALALVVVAVVAAVIIVRARQAPPSAADCEKEPPKVEFAVAECDGGEAPAQGSAPAAAPRKP